MSDYFNFDDNNLNGAQLHANGKPTDIYAVPGKQLREFNQELTRLREAAPEISEDDPLSGCCAKCDRVFSEISDPAVGHVVCAECVTNKSTERDEWPRD